MKKLIENIRYNRHYFYFLLLCMAFSMFLIYISPDKSPYIINLIVLSFFVYVFAQISRNLLERFEKRREEEEEKKKRKENEEVIKKYFGKTND